MQAAVMGLGSWGTAFGLVLADAGHQVHLWGRNPTTVAAVNTSRRNARFHPDLELPASVTAFADTRAALARRRPGGAGRAGSVTARANLAAWGDQIPPAAVVLSLLKGLEQGSHARMSEVVVARRRTVQTIASRCSPAPTSPARWSSVSPLRA